MGWKKWAFVIGLLVAGTLLLPQGSQGFLGIVFYMLAVHSLVDHYRQDMSQYLKMSLSLLGGVVLTLLVTNLLSLMQ